MNLCDFRAFIYREVLWFAMKNQRVVVLIPFPNPLGFHYEPSYFLRYKVLELFEMPYLFGARPSVWLKELLLWRYCLKNCSLLPRPFTADGDFSFAKFCCTLQRCTTHAKVI